MYMYFFMYLISLTFYRFYPVNRDIMLSKTDVNVEIRNDTLFIYAECHSPYGIFTEAVDRDNIKNGEDFFGVILTQNRNSGYFFMANANGIKEDGMIVQRSTKKKEWDFVWSVETKIISDTLWTAEFEIPLDQTNFKRNGDSIVLYMNFVRCAKLQGTGNFEEGTMVPIKGHNFYDLEFTKRYSFKVKENKNAVSLFNEPYVAVYHDNIGTYFAGGGDVSLKTNNGNIAITVNPEYATVEGDIEKFNLNKNEMLYYPEKRPFFMNGFELWSMPFQVLYTRRLQDIDAGIKVNVNTQKAGVNIFLLEEKDTASNYVSRKRLTGGLRALYSSKYFELGGFYLRSRDTFETKGMDVMFFLPSKFHLNVQYTADLHEKSDIFVHLYRYVRPGINVEGGFERLDSVTINTAYMPYPVFTRSMWLYLTFNFLRGKEFLPYYAIGIGGTHGEYLDGRFFENNGSLFITLGLLNNLHFVYNYIPWKRYAPWNDTTYINSLHYINLQYQPFSHHHINLDVQTGKYFGGTQKYYSLEYSYKGKRLHLSAGYGYDEEPFYTQKRVYLKGKWNITQKLRFRLFAQHSGISNEDEIDFLTEYKLRPGTSLYFVVNRYNFSDGTSETRLMAKFKSYFEIR